MRVFNHDYGQPNHVVCSQISRLIARLSAFLLPQILPVSSSTVITSDHCPSTQKLDEMYRNLFQPHPPAFQCDNSLNLPQFVRHRAVGLCRKPSSRQASIIGYLNKTRYIIEERRYKFKTGPSHPLNMMMAVDVSGQNILIGGTSRRQCYFQCANLVAKNNNLDQTFIHGHQLQTLQWTPHGCDQFMVNLYKGIKIFDSSRQQVIYDNDIQNVYHQLNGIPRMRT